MEQQFLSEIRHLLQQKIFGHSCVQSFNPFSRAVFNRLRISHTAGIGVHHLKCNASSCDNNQYQYHSCGDRHCPNCGGNKKEQWLQDSMSELLPTTYYHLVLHFRRSCAVWSWATYPFYLICYLMQVTIPSPN